ncbi:sulfate adenylyltransferase [Candidatus Omnitrophota bacterium]
MEKKIKKEIICTLGPASMKERVIVRLEGLGVSLFRINLSHTRLKDVTDIIRYVQGKTSVPLCLDTEGAQIRTGYLHDNEVLLPENSVVRVPFRGVAGDQNSFNLYPADIVKELKVGDFISIDFNSVLAQVIEKKPSYTVMRILAGGVMGQNKAVSVERDIAMPPLTEKDRKALAIGAGMGIRHVALSFASRATDIDEIRAVSGKNVFVISKIESLKGVANFEEIASKSDALLLDRGDLSRQVPIERIPGMQKDIIVRARRSGRKIYVATNLLESMVTALTPTRAEVNDVFNTLSDGADGLVLAAETAIGAHPVNCATMISRIIRQYVDFAGGCTIEDMHKKDHFLLAEPHGGTLVNRVIDDPDMEDISGYRSLEVDETVLMDAEQIALGAFSPLEGFMDRRELKSVLDNCRLPGGVVWPLPIVLQVKKEEAAGLKAGDSVALVLEGTKDVYAILRLEDVYTYDLDKISADVFGTDDDAHPGVRSLKKRGNCFLGGKIELIKRLPSKYKYFEITPKEARIIFEKKGWSRVVGFHTRNVIHRAHEHIQLRALEKYHCDGLLVHPVIGPKKKGDYNSDIILKSYELMRDRFYPEGKVVLGAFQSYSRYSGPREAVFTALCRKNFGCSHFVVGRDHAGVGKYYRSYDAHRMFDSLGDIGIAPVFFDEVHYCSCCCAYVDRCKHGDGNILKISGSEGRSMLQSEKRPPDWFMRDDISDLVINEIREGKEVFVR